jgi:hypothetical protein
VGISCRFPSSPTVYDLVTESDEGLKRVQVKTTRAHGKSGRYVAKTSHHIRSNSSRRNANGNRQAVPYTPDLIDLFFIVTPSQSYIIPIEVVGNRLTIALDEKYAEFAV